MQRLWSIILLAAFNFTRKIVKGLLAGVSVDDLVGCY